MSTATPTKKRTVNRQRLIIAIVALILVIGGVLAITGGKDFSESVIPAEGGRWDYGSSAGRTWSNFLNDKPHSASVQGHEFHDTGCIKGETWARAQTGSKWIGILGDEQEKQLCEVGE